MLKIFFGIITDPLGLPLAWYWEAIIMAIIGVIAFVIGFIVSPGGEFGSIIHWIVRFVAFAVLWAIVYGVIVAAQWVGANWVLVLCVLGAVALIITVISIIRN